MLSTAEFEALLRALRELYAKETDHWEGLQKVQSALLNLPEANSNGEILLVVGELKHLPGREEVLGRFIGYGNGLVMFLPEEGTYDVFAGLVAKEPTGYRVQTLHRGEMCWAAFVGCEGTYAAQLVGHTSPIDAHDYYIRPERWDYVARWLNKLLPS